MRRNSFSPAWVLRAVNPVGAGLLSGAAKGEPVSLHRVLNHDECVALGDFNLSPALSGPGNGTFMGSGAREVPGSSLQLSTALVPVVPAVAGRHGSSLRAVAPRCL